MRLLRDAGARPASLYVDGMNPMRAHDVYGRLGFEVVYEAEVWDPDHSHLLDGVYYVSAATTKALRKELGLD
jgi:hypothetical protein